MDKINVKDVLTELFNPNGVHTTYVGEIPAPWDTKTKSWKFNSHYDYVFNNTKIISQLDTYFAQITRDLKWLHLKTEGFAIQLTNGLEPATFKDSDFVIKDCSFKLAHSHPTHESVTGLFDFHAHLRAQEIAEEEAYAAYKTAYIREMTKKPAPKAFL
jgi:hypothetical protein